MKKKTWIIILIIAVIIGLLFFARHFYLSKFTCELRCRKGKQTCRYEELVNVCTIKSERMWDYFGCVETPTGTICGDIMN